MGQQVRSGITVQSQVQPQRKTPHRMPGPVWSCLRPHSRIPSD